MPSPNAAPNASFKKPQDKLEFGQKLAKRKSQEFGDKVAQWNSNGGGLAPSKSEKVTVVTEHAETTFHYDTVGPAAVIVEPESNNDDHDDKENRLDQGIKADKIAITPTTPDRTLGAKRMSREVDIGRKAWVRRKSKSQVEQPFEVEEVVPDVKHAGTPKKRVVSDGHWRRDRLAKVETPEKEQPIPVPKPIVIRNSVASIGLKLPPTTANVIEEREIRRPSKFARRSASRSRSRSRERTISREETPDYESSGTKVYIKKRTPSRQLDSRPVSREHQLSRTNSGELSGETPTSKLRKPPALAPPSASVERYLRLLVPTHEQLSPKERAEAPSEIIAQKRRISRRSPRVSTHHDDSDGSRDAERDVQLPQPPLVYGNRIQGWLATTTDPFDSTQSLKLGPLRQTADRSPQILQTERDDERTTGRSLPSEANLDASPRTPTLKRRGARRTATSPIKERLSRDCSLVLDSAGYSKPKDTSLTLADRTRPREISNAKSRLPTIASVETFTSLVSGEHSRFVPDGSVLSRASDGDEHRPPGVLRRRLTKHSDLISALSAQRANNKSGRTRRSVRSNRNGADLTVGDIMNDLTTDELRYQRELRTLVDGVIPVLLQYVLSDSRKPSSAVLGTKSSDSQLVTKPIVDMGVALERLKTLHKRIPLHDPAELITWAESARSVYSEYISVWRLGFKDVVVNLAPAEYTEKKSGFNEGLSRNEKGELLSGDGDGERVDVAYLLKRPLVRLKHLAKTFDSIDFASPQEQAKEMAAKYDDIVQQAKARVNEEKARLEDEAAAAIDATRARECRTLAPIAGVRIDASRCVRARDYFDLDFRHSDGQQINCKIELIFRDDASGRGDAGDVLFCEVSPTERWLLLPPVHSTMISARQGRKQGQMVVMLRGYRNDGSEWRETMSLEAEEEVSIDEWLEMLPSSPVPRNLITKSSFDLMRNPMMSGALPEPSISGYEIEPSIAGTEVPLGERYDKPTETWDASEVNSDAGDHTRSTIRRRRLARHRSQPADSIPEEPYAYEVDQRGAGFASRSRPRSEQYASDDRAKTIERPPTTPGPRYASKDNYSVWMPSSRQPSHESSAEEDAEPVPKRPSSKRRTSSVPSLEFPTVNKLRKPERQSALTPQKELSSDLRAEPISAPAESRQRRRTPPEASKSVPTTPDAKSKPASFGLKSLPSFTPAFLKRHRRSSSPLKHEYAPSSESSLSDSEISAPAVDDNYTSDSSAEQVHDDQISTLGELKSFPAYGGYKSMRQQTPPDTVYAPSDPSLGPSQSASQSPYRTVPPPEIQAVTTVASIFAWAESGSWESLHPEDCCIVVTPGLIEAFDAAQAHAAPAATSEEASQSPSTRGVKPLVALELTPLVPLRRGTALDISIRSPPTDKSLYRTGNNIMFRSRNAEECEALYYMLNRARIDNPTYIALQRARGPMAQSNWGEVMAQRNSARPASGSWFGLGSRKGSTYRSNSISRPRSIAVTESSVGTMQSAFSALRRFSGGNKIFNIAKSTITSRQGSRTTYSDSLDSGVATPAQIDPTLGTPLGLTNMKIRLYIRETASKWRDLGQAQLTILIPPRPDPFAPANPLLTGREKRIMIHGKAQGQVLVDATLGEAAFERIARTGIAMSITEDNVDGLVATTGGVLIAKTRIYMIQMRSDREAAYTFGLVGKLRY